ncbi:hypothetical protein BZG00_08015 [Salinivibrio kushneri]|uniref:Uncharacterized protein n=2 Tax=Salinivibrio kushneri TaxID=1908198 RepID=A0AB36JVZ5_9GAMM|nr:hypothetical protein BZG00_08015 [Salinivibrio kushneri]
MAEFMNFPPIAVVFPDEEDGPTSSTVSWVDEAQLREKLSDSLPVDNLMIWLREHYPHLPNAALLRLYHELVQEPQWESTLGPHSNTTALNTVVVTYYPHKIRVL